MYSSGMTDEMKTGDIVQDHFGWFFRVNAGGTADQLSASGTVQSAAIDRPIVLVRDGAATTAGDPLATRVAVVMARRYVHKGV